MPAFAPSEILAADDAEGVPMARFLAIIYGSQQLWSSFSPEEWQAAIAAQDAFNDKYRRRGELVTAFGLDDESQARTVRVRAGAAAVTDGPYLETKEYIASAFVLECADVERALEVAAEIPYAAVNAVEVWPIRHGDGATS
jgi:hypothetical protein